MLQPAVNALEKVGQEKDAQGANSAAGAKAANSWLGWRKKPADDARNGGQGQGQEVSKEPASATGESLTRLDESAPSTFLDLHAATVQISTLSTSIVASTTPMHTAASSSSSKRLLGLEGSIFQRYLRMS